MMSVYNHNVNNSARVNACFYLLIDNWSHGGVYSSHLTSLISIYTYNVNLYARASMLMDTIFAYIQCQAICVDMHYVEQI